MYHGENLVDDERRGKSWVLENNGSSKVSTSWRTNRENQPDL